MRLSPEGEELLIHNLKPNLHPEYTNEVDREEIARMRIERLGSKAAGLLGAQHLPTEVSDDEENLTFDKTISAATCKISQIKSFVFGG